MIPFRFCVPIQYLKYLWYSWELGEALCHAVHYVQKFTMVCSVLTLTTISIERYLYVMLLVVGIMLKPHFLYGGYKTYIVCLRPNLQENTK